MMVMHRHCCHSGLGTIAGRPIVHRQATQWQSPRGQHPQREVRDTNASSDAHKALIPQASVVTLHAAGRRCEMTNR